MRWIRLDAAWDDSSWLFVLSEGSQLAWIKLLCHVKVQGINGRCKAMSTIVAAKRWGIGEESVAKMLEAGRVDGAISCIDGEWIVNNWAKYQEVDPTAKERMKRMRERQKAEVEPEPVTELHPVTRNNRNVRRNLSRDIDRDIDNKPQETNVSSPLGGQKKFFKPTLEEASEYMAELGCPGEAQAFLDHHQARGWKLNRGVPMSDWRAACRTWKRVKDQQQAPKGNDPKHRRSVGGTYARLADG